MDAVKTGCQWAMLPNDFPTQRYFYDWRSNGLLESINHWSWRPGSWKDARPARATG